jgi:hypothetical protein
LNQNSLNQNNLNQNNLNQNNLNQNINQNNSIQNNLNQNINQNLIRNLNYNNFKNNLNFKNSNPNNLNQNIYNPIYNVSNLNNSNQNNNPIQNVNQDVRVISQGNLNQENVNNDSSSDKLIENNEKHSGQNNENKGSINQSLNVVGNNTNFNFKNLNFKINENVSRYSVNNKEEFNFNEENENKQDRQFQFHSEEKGNNDKQNSHKNKNKNKIEVSNESNFNPDIDINEFKKIVNKTKIRSKGKQRDDSPDKVDKTVKTQRKYKLNEASTSQNPNDDKDNMDNAQDKDNVSSSENVSKDNVNENNENNANKNNRELVVSKENTPKGNIKTNETDMNEENIYKENIHKVNINKESISINEANKNNSEEILNDNRGMELEEQSSGNKNRKRKVTNESSEKSVKRVKSFNLKDILEDNVHVNMTSNEGMNVDNTDNNSNSVKSNSTDSDNIDIECSYAFLAINTLIEPSKYCDIKNKPDKVEWYKAINDELDNMKTLGVYQFIKELPKNANVVTAKWVFKYKYDAEGNIAKRKARLVARGFTQQYGIDYNETFSPTLKQDSLRVVTALAAKYHYKIYQIDIKAAYLNAELDEDIYLEIPEGATAYKRGYWKLRKALYGLKQSGRLWNETLNKVLTKIGFKRLRSDPCLYTKQNKQGKIICIVTVYVDDILLTGEDKEIDTAKKLLNKEFNVTDIGLADIIIGIKFVKCGDGYLLHQKRYLDDILTKFNVDSFKPCSNTIPEKHNDLAQRKFDPTKYRQAIGSLLYLAICTRPDILFSVSRAARKSQDPNYEDWVNVLKIFRYLKAKPNYGIKFTSDNELKVFVDADFGGDEETRRSTTGYVIMMGSGPTSWYSKLQHCVSVSTAESEYYSLNECARHCLWYENLFKELNINCKCVNINIDNKAAIYNSENETINPRSRHIDIKYHQIRELIKERKIKLSYIKSEKNLADGFTKFLNTTLMNKFRDSLLTKF